MDWQQFVALALVAGVAALFGRAAWQRWRLPYWRRRLGCRGCGVRIDRKRLPTVRRRAARGRPDRIEIFFAESAPAPPKKHLRAHAT